MVLAPVGSLLAGMQHFHCRIDPGRRRRCLVALQRGGIPAEAGLPSDPQRLRKRRLGPLTATWLVYLGTLLVVVVFCFLVSGFAFFTPDHKPVTLISDTWVNSLKESPISILHVVAIVLKESSRPAALVLSLAGLMALSYLVFEMVRLPRVPRQRMYVVLILTFFSMLFFAFFEQAGSSLTNFTDRNVDRVTGRRKITAAEIGQTIEIQPTQKQLGYHNGNQLFTLNILTDLREGQKKRQEEARSRGDTTLDPRARPDFTIPWKVAPDNVDMEIAEVNDEIPAGTFQSVNAIFILIFGLPFTAPGLSLRAAAGNHRRPSNSRWGSSRSDPASWPSGTMPAWRTSGAWSHWSGWSLAICCTPRANSVYRR